MNDKKYSQASLDVLSNMVLAERSLAGPGSQTRQRLARLCLALAAAGGGGRQTFREEELKSMSDQLARLAKLANIGDQLTASCDTSWLYWHRDLLPPILGHLYTSKAADRLHHLVAAVKDAVPILMSARHRPGDQMVAGLRLQMETGLMVEIVEPLCRDIETELRLTVHQQAGLKLDDRNPFRAAPPDLQPFLKIAPLHLLGSALSIRGGSGSYACLLEHDKMLC